MTNKKPNFIIQFDSKKYSKEEQEYLIYRFVFRLMSISAKHQAEKTKTKKEQQRIKNELMNFGLKVIKEVQIHSSVN